MKENNIILTGPFSDVEVIIERKIVKKIRLKVFPNGIVRLSAPLGVTDEWINDYQ